MKTALFSVSYAGLFMDKRPHLSSLDMTEARIQDIKQALGETKLKTVGWVVYEMCSPLIGGRSRKHLGSSRRKFSVIL
ncbi:hypothetical protein CSA56_07890 [candidate division KSB3 bacterium]|uniref:Uncharacterized protein n=1 Tax=candidate division KSB3 bacterium TaxID=2044937 RepID=A0A2G6KF41_9BACT|nr:MAG: hypothetical protein CSA56_07890 [candidate division KSB3 bacterium]